MSTGSGNTSVPKIDPVARPFAAVAAAVADGLQRLVRQHLELARLEVVDAVAVRGRAAGMFAGAAAIVFYAIGFIAAAGAAALAIVLPVWGAILVVGVLLLLAAGVLVLVGRRAMDTAPPAGERTRKALREDARWARRQITS